MKVQIRKLHSRMQFTNVQDCYYIKNIFACDLIEVVKKIRLGQNRLVLKLHLLLQKNHIQWIAQKCSQTGNVSKSQDVPSPSHVNFRPIRSFYFTTETDKHQLLYDDMSGTVSLLIKSIGPGDEGEYTCTALNPYGEAICTVYISPEATKAVKKSRSGHKLHKSSSNKQVQMMQQQQQQQQQQFMQQQFSASQSSSFQQMSTVQQQSSMSFQGKAMSFQGKAMSNNEVVSKYETVEQCLLTV